MTLKSLYFSTRTTIDASVDGKTFKADIGVLEALMSEKIWASVRRRCLKSLKESRGADTTVAGPVSPAGGFHPALANRTVTVACGSGVVGVLGAWRLLAKVGREASAMNDLWRSDPIEAVSQGCFAKAMPDYDFC